MRPDAERVQQAAAAWLYVPPDARVVERASFTLVAYPEHWSDTTVATRWRGSVDVDEVLTAARDLGREEVWFYEVDGGDLENELQRRDAVLTETLAVLALDLTGDLPDLDVPARTRVRDVAGLADLRSTDRIAVEVFGGELRDDEVLLAGDHEGLSLALLDGEPVGTAGRTVAGDVLRLWGGAVLPEARGAGAYRALLAHRLAAGRAAGCTLALVKGRVETSAPVLTRAGFTAYGEVRAYRLPTS